MSLCHLHILQGWIRGREWQVNNLVHFAGVGVYQLHSARSIPDPCPTTHPARVAGCVGVVPGRSAAGDVPSEILATAAETLVQSLPYDPMNAEQSHFRLESQTHLSSFVTGHASTVKLTWMLPMPRVAVHRLVEAGERTRIT